MMILLLVMMSLLSHIKVGESQLTSELDDLEVLGSSPLSSQQSSNTVPMIGKKASSHTRPDQSSKIPQFFYPYLIRVLDLGLRGRESYPEIGKRGFPSFSVPDYWKKKSSSRPSLSKLRHEMMASRHKKSASPIPRSFSTSWLPTRDNQWFRFHDDSNPLRRVFKRNENHLKDYNSVPFMGE